MRCFGTARWSFPTSLIRQHWTSWRVSSEFPSTPVIGSASIRTLGYLSFATSICTSSLDIGWTQSVQTSNAEWYGIAQDIQVNEMLVKYFGFVRENIHNWKEKCWIDVVFREAANVVKPDMSCDYYYDLIMQCVPKT